MIRCTVIPKGKRRPLMTLDHEEYATESLAVLSSILHVGVWSKLTLTHAETGDSYVYELVSPPAPQP